MLFGVSSNGRTAVSGAVCEGSTPSTPAKLLGFASVPLVYTCERTVAPSSSGLGRRPLKAEVAGSNPVGATKIFPRPAGISCRPRCFLGALRSVRKRARCARFRGGERKCGSLGCPLGSCGKRVQGVRGHIRMWCEVKMLTIRNRTGRGVFGPVRLCGNCITTDRRAS